ncbi:Ig-like domain-containing protein [Martelella alba]|uniref:Big-1 domain-containing protein n=1 Tax=Martelella alba TaxID=2590451 RepID=A0ABY2SNR9_9HYPH|nr:Ig-like domain-containing protein [Martelella alba]TKI06150.1 hypothetical protein FCN80_11595 [Martelella alba]
MALLPPVLPQQADGVISTQRITTDNGIIVEVPLYGNLSVGDIVRLYWNGNLMDTYTITSITDLPKIFLLPSSAGAVGNNIVYYTSTDTVGNLASSPFVNVTIVQGSVETGYTLLSTVVIDNAQAGSSPGNIIIYTLNYNNSVVANSYLLFTSQGGTLSAAFGQTNDRGQYQLSITSNVQGSVLVTATPTVATDKVNNTVVSFTPASVSYNIEAAVLSNNAPANNIAQNIVSARLYNAGTGAGIAGQVLLVTVAGQASYPSLVSTDSQGYAYIALTSTTAGTVSVTVTQQSNPSVFATASVNFAVSYPILLGKQTAYLWGNIGLQTFLGPYNIVINHHYYIVPSRQPYQVKNCGTGYAFTVSNSSCSRDYGRYYTFLNTNLSDVIAIASGAGANLTSERYYYYPDSHAGEAEIQVWDYGPYYSSAFNLPRQDSPAIDEAIIVPMAMDEKKWHSAEDNGEGTAPMDNTDNLAKAVEKGD